ncbi:MAG TPA: three-Cys-motif partner protein TcmP [Chryseolinea sp.]|nr:three-Cys-motif partner protein TcmP [Chryseolinea sp.]
MPYKDLHSEPFDETTITKLEIFEDYAEAWIPTFVMQPGIDEIHVFDFFSGPGCDKNEVAGSPIRLLAKITSYLGLFLSTKTKIVLHLNEFEPTKVRQEKFDLLKKNCEEFLVANPKLRYFVTVEYYNEDAETLFFKLLPKVKKYPSLVYLDQNGVKFISKQFIQELEKLSSVDFIYFVSSSYFWRLGGTEEFKRVLDFDMEELKKGAYRNIHRTVIGALKKELPINTTLKMFPFSLKKGTNIYGIIFGAKHFRAVDKFLDVAWKRNQTNGEADFDIDNDEKKSQLDIFEGRKMTKVETFKIELEELILSGSLKDNRELLIYTYEAGHLPTHSVEVMKRLKKNGKILYDGKTPAINYENVFKKKNIVEYKLK